MFTIARAVVPHSVTCVAQQLGCHRDDWKPLYHKHRRIVWVGGSNGSAEPSSHGVHFTDIMMHALASPSEDFPRHSIYMQLDGAQAADDEDGSNTGPPEVRLVPAEPSQSECHNLLPT